MNQGRMDDMSSMGVPAAGALGVAALAIGGAAGFLAWQRERNKPINKMRRRLQGATKDISRASAAASKDISRRSAAALENAPDAAPMGISGTVALALAMAAARYFATRSSGTPAEKARDEASSFFSRLDLDSSREMFERSAGLSRELFGLGADRAQDSFKKVSSDKRVKSAMKDARSNLKDARGSLKDARKRVEETDASPKLLGIGATPIVLAILGFIGWKIWDSNREAPVAPYIQESHMA